MESLHPNFNTMSGTQSSSNHIQMDLNHFNKLNGVGSRFAMFIWLLAATSISKCLQLRKRPQSTRKLYITRQIINIFSLILVNVLEKPNVYLN